MHPHGRRGAGRAAATRWAGQQQHQPPPLPCTSLKPHYYATTHQITARQIKVAWLFWVATVVHEGGGGGWWVEEGGGWRVVVVAAAHSRVEGRGGRPSAVTHLCSAGGVQGAPGGMAHCSPTRGRQPLPPCTHSPGLTLSRRLSFSLFLAHSVSCSGWLAPRCRFSKWRKDGTSTLFYLFSPGTSVLGPFAEI